ncbi:hypothetical protein [Kitasatospora sp. NPDC057198]|uniref:hypothetical protein n=1 Tax=Kitasatospora sp. NPDC057198 TaxID=3346046 RepID=UPI0036361E7C
MSVIVTFFRAPGHAAATAAARGPGSFVEALEYGNFDADEALTGWEALLTGRGFDEVLAEERPEDELPPDGGDGPLLLALSPALQARLATAAPTLLAATAARWVRELADDGVDFDPESATEILTSLARLARSATAAADRLYCLST